ncbi:histone-lysine N-methyltransferase ATXR3 isoform X1 [Lolium perenne]|uniref:histone-lysine N-methyltransferase ATXR3 isoform X1 n=1 Tax=Lolium perenne TaxID=4522 RepID=UPI0021EACA18|nr:histone-lysine N-methyltransferase ATXR3 isoform X2 [Lolium perenne]
MGDGGVACAVRAVEGFRANALVRRAGGETMPDKEDKTHQHHHHRHHNKQQPASAADLEEGELQLNGDTRDMERTMPPKKWRKLLPASPAPELEPGEIVAPPPPSRKARRNGDLDKPEAPPARHRKDTPDKVTPLEKKRDRDHSRSSSAKKGSSRDSDEEPGEIKPEASCSGSARKSHAHEPASSHRKHQPETCNQSGSKSRRKGEPKTSSSSAGKHYSARNHDISPPIRDRHDRFERSPGILGRFPHDRVRHDRSPGRSERSPRDRGRHHDNRDRSPYISPLHRARQPHHRDSTPIRMDSSPRGRTQHEDTRDRTPLRRDRSSSERARTTDSHETSKKSTDSNESSKKSRPAKLESNNNLEDVQHRNKSTKQSTKSKGGSNGKSEERISKEKVTESIQPAELPPPPPLPPPLPPPPPPPPPLPPTMPPPSPPPPVPDQLNDVVAEDVSMEEDMDICDTPPHTSQAPQLSTEPTTTIMGKWFYLDQLGVEQGPSKLSDLKKLVEDGYLLSDHLIKHADSNRWVTVENAASPLVSSDFPSVHFNLSTQKVSPPGGRGNLLGQVREEATLLASGAEDEQEEASEEHMEDLYIENRVEALMCGSVLVDGRELEILGEALDARFEPVDWERSGHREDFPRFQVQPAGDDGINRGIGFTDNCVTDIYGVGPVEKEKLYHDVESSEWFSGGWSCKGGDWKRNDEFSQDKPYRKKLVLNEGYSLCQMPKGNHEDPRWHCKDDLYYPVPAKKLDLPLWAFSSTEENTDTIDDASKSAVIPGRSSQRQPPKGVKGMMLPVVKINARVVKDQSSVEPCIKSRGADRSLSRSSRSHSIGTDRSSVHEGLSHSKRHNDYDSHSLHKSKSVPNIPEDHVCTLEELSVKLGDWYYLDGTGHEHGPFSYSELQKLVKKGTILERSSVFRKIDNTWLPVVKDIKFDSAVRNGGPGSVSTSSLVDQSNVVVNHGAGNFHELHPQFVGYTRGKLHELVMKYFKSRELTLAINEVLDPWIAAKQPKKEIETFFSNNSASRKFFPEDAGSAKRARLLPNQSDEDIDIYEDILASKKDDWCFEDLCPEGALVEENSANSIAETESWGLLDGHVLARIFHFLRADVKSLISSAATCRLWNTTAKYYRNTCRFVDLSSVGLQCTDSVFRDIMAGYEKQNIKTLILVGCSNLSPLALGELLVQLPHISYVHIQGCSQLGDMKSRFQHIKWIRSSLDPEEPAQKIKSLKQIDDGNNYPSEVARNLTSQLGGSDELDGYFADISNRENANLSFGQGFYKRSKWLDARKSSAVMSKDAQLRRLMQRKAENSYRKMEEFVMNRLREIMKSSRFDFFIPKVAKIEGRLKSGYYARHGFSSLKNDIRSMCRDALRFKGRSDLGDMKQIVLSFVKLANRLGNPRLISEGDGAAAQKDISDTSQYSSDKKLKKKQSKTTGERRGANWTTASAGADASSRAFDREIKRNLSKLKKRDVDSGSETSDDDDGYSEGDETESETTVSDTESDLDLNSAAWDLKVNGMKLFESGDSVTDDRGWGARMTKASLVPPVTRKYEVIEKYLIVADEEEVQRKMRVALPDDYSEKLLSQKNGTENLEIPEVKDYQRRKAPDDEVLEQEVYGIDPYTHNLLHDIMPADGWSSADKNTFIEELLLNTLNKQVRDFTGSGNTPMVYPLKPVIEEIQKSAEESGDRRNAKMCYGMLKAMRSRPEHNYVAYRKGLGVVCNKKGGFGVDDFVIEFFGEVYPSWRWYEKQDGIKHIQNNSEDQAPEFYNIMLERPKGDRDGYDLVFVDAMHKANYASRICHSCNPNCEAKVTAVDGQYQIGVYTVRPIAEGEEITFDYNSVTESKEEHEASVCLCGSQVCRGSYLNFSGEGAFEKVLMEFHGVLDRHSLLLQACEANTVSQQDLIDLGRAGLGTCLLAGLPGWLVAYTAHLVRFIFSERQKLPNEIFKHNVEEKRQFFTDINMDSEKNDAEVQAEGVLNSRLQNLTHTLDKVRYVMRCIFGDAKNAPPPLVRLTGRSLVSAIWKGEGSLVDELLQSIEPHVEEDVLADLKEKIRVHDPSDSEDIEGDIRNSLLWLRDELRSLSCTYKCRHDAAADLIHMYAYTKCFFRVRDYKTVKSPPVHISPLDLGPKYADKLGPGFQEYSKTYPENYCLAQLIYWYSQNAEPESRLTRARKGCMSLPDVSSFYVKSVKPTQERVYGTRTVRFMLSRMEKQAQRPWPKDRIWVFKNDPKFFGTPMMDGVLNNSSLDKEMVHWLKTRSNVFLG